MVNVVKDMVPVRKVIAVVSGAGVVRPTLTVVRKRDANLNSVFVVTPLSESKSPDPRSQSTTHGNVVKV